MIPLPPGGLPAAITTAVTGVAEAVDLQVTKNEVTLMLGPWAKGYGIGFDDDGRIDDAPGYSGRLAGPEGSEGKAGKPGVLGDPASRSNTLVIGIEMGLQRFLALDLEAVSKLGRAYLVGSIDFVKVKAELFGDLLLETPDLGPSAWGSGGRYKGDPSCYVGLRVGAQVLFELIGAHYEAGCDVPLFSMGGKELTADITVRLDAAVHAFARCYAEGSVGTRNALLVGGKAFVGASTTLAGQAELASMIGARGSVTAWAGAGAEFTFGVQADFVKHQYGYTNSAGLAAGAGVSYDYGVTVDAGALLTANSAPSPFDPVVAGFVERVDDAYLSMRIGRTLPTEFCGEVWSAAGDATQETVQVVGEGLR